MSQRQGNHWYTAQQTGERPQLGHFECKGLLCWAGFTLGNGGDGQLLLSVLTQKHRRCCLLPGCQASGPAGHWHPPAPPSSTFHPKITFPFVKKAKNPPVRLPYTFHMATPHTTTESVQQTNSVIMLGKTIGSRSVSYHHSPML